MNRLIVKYGVGGIKPFSIIIFIILISSTISEAACTGSMINPITDVRWSCMMPISLGGISFADVPVPGAASAIIADKISGAASPTCTCFDPLPRPGLTFAMNNIFRMAEAVKDPLCFPSIGLPIGAGPFGLAGADGGSSGASTKTSKTTFNYTHLISFVPTQVLNLFIDALCLQLSETYAPFTVLYLSEFMPQAKSSEFALLLAPESVLFANPVAQAYCMVDAALTVIEQTDPIGYWCAGGHSIFPLSNHAVEVDYVDASSINVAKIIFTLSRSAQILSCLGSQALCSCFPTLIWNKREFRLQIAKPIPDIFCRRIGKPSLLWNTPNKNTPLIRGADNLVFMVWRRRDCCAL